MPSTSRRKPSRIASAAARRDLREADRLEHALDERQQIGTRVGQVLDRCAPASPWCRRRRESGRRRLRRGRCSFPRPPARDRRAARSRSRRRASGRPGTTTTGTSGRTAAPASRPETCGPSDRSRPSCPPAPSRSSSIRFAPAEKFGASLPTTSAAKFAAASFTPAVQHLQRVAADGVHLRVELDGQHAVAEIDEARAGVAADDALAILGGLEDLQIGRGGRQVAVAEAGAARQQRRLRADSRVGAARHRPRARRSRPRFQTAPAPSRSPTASPDRHRRSSARSPAPRAPCRAASGRASGAGRRRPCRCRGTAS